MLGGMTLGSGMVSASALQTPIMVRRHGEEEEAANQAKNIWLPSETMSVAFSLIFSSLLSQVVIEKMKSEGVYLSRKWKVMIFILFNTGQINTTMQKLNSGLRILLMVWKMMMASLTFCTHFCVIKKHEIIINK